jgi:hypothetical protein
MYLHFILNTVNSAALCITLHGLFLNPLQGAVCLAIFSSVASCIQWLLFNFLLNVTYLPWFYVFAGSIPDGVIGIFDWHNPFGRTMALGSTRPLTEMSTRNIF